MEVYLGVKEVVERYPFLNVGTLGNLRARNQGPSYLKLGKRVIYKVSDLEKWFELKSVVPTGNYKEGL
jgi:hypothetical protein